MSKDRDRTRLIQRDRTPKHLIAWDKNSPKTKQIQEQSHRGIGIQSPTRSYLLSHHLSAILAIAICCYHQDERDREWCGGRKRDVPCASSMDGWLRQVLSEVERGGWAARRFPGRSTCRDGVSRSSPLALARRSSKIRKEARKSARLG